ncbi:unnamed protein product, partial [Amoebophrya sp. A25]
MASQLAFDGRAAHGRNLSARGAFPTSVTTRGPRQGISRFLAVVLGEKKETGNGGGVSVTGG